MAGGRRRRSSTEGEVRERLLEAATELFARKGYSATTTREIVAAAKVTKPVLYYYFRNKEGIYLEIMDRSFRRFEAVVEEATGETGGITGRLLSLCDRVFLLVLERLDVVRVMYSIYYGPPQGAPFFDFDAVHLKLFEAIRQLVMEGIRKKELKGANPEEMTWAVLGAFHVAMENELSHPERKLGREGLRDILDLILLGLQRKGISTRRNKR